MVIAVICVSLLQHLTFFRAAAPERVFFLACARGGTSAFFARDESAVGFFLLLSFRGTADSSNHTDTDRNERVRPVRPLLTPVPTCCRCRSGTHFRLSWCSRLNRAVGPASLFAHRLLFLCVCCFCDVFSSMKMRVLFLTREGRRMLTSHRAVWRPAPAAHFDVTFKNPFDAKRKGCGPVRVGAHTHLH